MNSLSTQSSRKFLGLMIALLAVTWGSGLMASPRSSRGGSTNRTARARSVKPARPAAGQTVVWTRVRKALLARPLDSHAQVASVLSTDRKLSHIRKIDASFVTRQIDANGGRQAIWAARDRATAERVAARLQAVAPGKSSLRSMARLLSDELPGIKDHNLAKLKARHPDILGDLAARSITKPVPPAARARIKQLALAHPTLSYAQLAGVFKKDAQLRGVLTWSEAEVSRLREPSRILPSETKRARALARLAADHLGGLSAGTSLEAGIASLAAKHPGVDQAGLMKLAPRTPELARAIRRLQPGAGSAAEAHGLAPLTLDLTRAKKLNPGRMVIQRCLELPDSPLVGRYREQLRTLEREAGDNNGKLSPRDLAASADPHLAAVMRRVYGKTGRKGLPLSEVYARLPAAIAAVANDGRLKKNTMQAPLYLEAVSETMGDISRRYQVEVLGGTRSASAFHGELGLSSRSWSRLQKNLPGALPRPGTVALTGQRLQGVAGLYRKLLAGELTTTGFYRRAKISAAQLRLLQTTDPQHFPRPEGTASWKTVGGRRNADYSPSSLAALSRLWHQQVLGGHKGVNQFKRDNGVSHHRLAKLYTEQPDLFPRKGHQRSGLRTGGYMAHDASRRAQALFTGDVLLRQADIIKAINKDATYVAKHGKLTRGRYEQLHTNNPHLFPPLKDTSAILERLAGEVRGLLGKQPRLTPGEITA